MPRSQDSSRCLPCRRSGFLYQPEYLDGSRAGAETPDPTSTSQGHSQVQGSTLSDRSDFTRPTESEYNSEPAPTFKSQSIPPRSFNDGYRRTVSRSDLEQCRQALRKTFRDCDQVEFRFVTRVISCVLNCARWLSRREVLAATTLLDLDRTSNKPMSANHWSQEEYWLRKCDSVITETPAGNMIFRSRSMRVFLRNFSIPGVDTSHTTLALICRNQIELDRHFASPPDANGPRILRAVQVLSPYVAAFKNHHLKAASLTSIIPVAEEDQAILKVKHSISEACDDFEIMQEGTEQLSLSEECDDWVMLAPAQTMNPPRDTESRIKPSYHPST